MLDTCRLCQKQNNLQYSHIIPAFAVRWLKRTSLTGRIRNRNSKVGLQESRRVRLLCSDCEQLLGRDEKTFCERIFIPYHDQQQQSFEYGIWLKRFIVGLHWRVLVTREDQYPAHAETAFSKAEVEWRSYLLGESSSHGSAEFHLFLAGIVIDSTDTLPKGLNWYLARGFDSTPIYSEAGMAGVYSKVIKALTFSYLAGKPEDEKVNGTLIADEGRLSVGQAIEGRFGSLIEDRAKMVEGLPSTISPHQREKLAEKAAANPEWVLRSEGFRIIQAEEQLKEKLNRKLQKQMVRTKTGF